METDGSDLGERLRTALGDGYALERELGGGGMSRVFLARDVRLGRRVVVKVLHPDLAAGLSASRFEREILLAARLQHPHVVPVHAAGDVDGLPYFTMPFVEGESLRARLAREGPLPVADAVRLVRELADALSYAHAQGVIHRDLKPENVLLSGGHAVVADFGVAKALASATAGGPSHGTTTGLGVAVGTPAYMAPEQALGDAATDHRADLYALGVIAYELLAGAHPFGARTPQKLVAAHVSEPVPPLASKRADVPPPLGALVERLLAKDPTDRPHDAADVVRQLDGLPAHTTPRGDTPSRVATGEEGVRAARRRRRRAAAGVALAAASIALGAWWFAASGRADRSDVASDAERPMLAVLPFKNLGLAEDAYFADGVTEEVTSRLAALSGLGVISRTSADQYRGTSKPLKQIARELGVEYVLEGSVRWDRTAGGPGRVRVSPQLIRVSDDTHLWADRFDAPAGDVFSVQGDVAQKVAVALNLTLGAGERRTLAEAPTRDLEAWALYLRAADAFARADHVSTQQAIALLDSAIGRDPSFALAYAALERYHLWLYRLHTDRSRTRLDLARSAAERALALAPTLPAAHQAMGHYYMRGAGDLDSALVWFSSALRLQPNNAAALRARGVVMQERGRYDEALRDLRRSADLDPRSLETERDLGYLHYLRRELAPTRRSVLRRYELAPDVPAHLLARAEIEFALAGDTAEARRMVRQAVARFGAETVVATLGTVLPAALTREDLGALEPTIAAAFADDRAGYVTTMVEFAHRLGRPAEGLAWADSVRQVYEPMTRENPDDASAWLAVGWSLARLGRAEEAQRAAERAVALSRGRALAYAEIRFLAAGVYLELGRHDDAIAHLAYALSVPSSATRHVLRLDSYWAPLRGNPAFERLIAEP